MRRILAALAAALMVIALGGHTATAHTDDAEAQPGSDEPVTLCLAAHPGTSHERTVAVPELIARVLLRTTASYDGPCAEYGESAERGNGTMTAYSQTADGVPVSVGLVFTEGLLDDLPHDPPTGGLWCYDKDGDGEVDPMDECAGGYEDALELGERFQREVDTPFTYVLNNWNPHGHMPPGVYDRPHFDVHFYMNPNAERLDIRVGPCEVLVHCDDYPLGKNLPDERYLHPDFEDLDAVEPAMGNHLVDVTAPEHDGEPFTHTFIYGVWDSEVTFYEPMVTHDWFTGMVEGTIDDACMPIKQPAAWQESGWYPTEYCTKHRENRGELTTSLESFVYREAS